MTLRSLDGAGATPAQESGHGTPAALLPRDSSQVIQPLSGGLGIPTCKTGHRCPMDITRSIINVGPMGAHMETCYTQRRKGPAHLSPAQIPPGNLKVPVLPATDLSLSGRPGASLQLRLSGWGTHLHTLVNEFSWAPRIPTRGDSGGGCPALKQPRCILGAPGCTQPSTSGHRHGRQQHRNDVFGVYWTLNSILPLSISGPRVGTTM